MTRTPITRQGARVVLSVGLIGCGYWGTKWLSALRRLPGCRVAAVCDSDQEAVFSAQQQVPGAMAVGSPMEVFGDPGVDAVVIATPAVTHAGLAEQALIAGKHVLVEKPMALDTRAAHHLVALAKRVRRVLMVDHTACYTGAARALADLIGQGELGEVLCVSAVRANLGLFRSDVNVLWDLAIHDVALIDRLMGKEPISVAAVAREHLPGYPMALADLCLRYPGGALARVHVSWLAPVKMRQTLVVGSKQMALYDDVNPTFPLQVFDRRVELSEADGSVRYRIGSTVSPPVDQTPPLEMVAAHFRDCVLLGVTPLTDGRAGLAAVRILEAADQSARAGGAPQLLTTLGDGKDGGSIEDPPDRPEGGVQANPPGSDAGDQGGPSEYGPILGG